MTDVIDWKKALEKCGDDEDFLKELLEDLRTEAKEHKSAIEEATSSEPFDLSTIHKQGSALESAASSILCTQLATTAGALEKAARLEESVDFIKERLKEFQEAHTKFEEYLEELGV